MTSPKKLMGAHMPALTALEIIGQPAIGLTATGTTQADALQLSGGVNTLSTTASSTGAKLPPCERGAMVVVNNMGAQTLAVYPFETSGVTVDSTTSASVATSRCAIFFGTGVDWAFCYGA
jgi:hypothetical protein